jgi:RNA polymerase sigma-70 factor (ECF subfamily)
MESDEELMNQVAVGDGEALASLLERHSAKLHGYLRRYTRSSADADDLLQETWVRVARFARRFDAARRFRTWLYGIATNLARDWIRRNRTRESGLLGARTEAHLVSSVEAGPGERHELQEHLDGLPDRMREVVLLRYFAGMNEAEMAASLGIAKGTVKSRLHTALKKLRNEYGVAQ